jgi:hypothetical protein
MKSDSLILIAGALLGVVLAYRKGVSDGWDAAASVRFTRNALEPDPIKVAYINGWTDGGINSSAITNFRMNADLLKDDSEAELQKLWGECVEMARQQEDEFHRRSDAEKLEHFDIVTEKFWKGGKRPAHFSDADITAESIRVLD